MLVVDAWLDAQWWDLPTFPVCYCYCDCPVGYSLIYDSGWVVSSVYLRIIYVVPTLRSFCCYVLKVSGDLDYTVPTHCRLVGLVTVHTGLPLRYIFCWLMRLFSVPDDGYTRFTHFYTHVWITRLLCSYDIQLDRWFPGLILFPFSYVYGYAFHVAGMMGRLRWLHTTLVDLCNLQGLYVVL